MPENVTGFQPIANLKKSLIDLAYFDMLSRRSPTFFREEPEYGWVRGAGSAAFILGSAGWSGDRRSRPECDHLGRVGFPCGCRRGSDDGGNAIAALDRIGKCGREPFHSRAVAAAGIQVGAHHRGAHARQPCHARFLRIRCKSAEISPSTASLLWSESVGAEVLVFVVIGPRLLDWIGPIRAMTLAAAAGIVRWTVMATRMSARWP
jgi:PPP family 3-phenylpropionic acid transporter